MLKSELKSNERFLEHDALQSLMDVLHAAGYTIVGPTIDQGAIVYDEIASVRDLPRGWTDEQGPATYRIRERDDDAYFGYVVGPHSWKRFLFPPHATVATADLTPAGWSFSTPNDPPPKFAFLGVRACELAAIRIQDQVFMSAEHVDPIYQQRRKEALIIAVNCTQAASTCFCSSMNTGPRCTSGFDLALTEILGDTPGFLIDAATTEGDDILKQLDTCLAGIQQLRAAHAARRRAEEQIQRRLDTTDIRDLLLSNLEHPRWKTVAERCLSCTNCTMVCPTCFCASVDEVTDLAGEHVERNRQWDSCFNPGFSYVNGGNIRDSVRSRYRQWLTHKLATWIDQFGTSGCVGCGRCIIWCPVSIDLTEEVAAIRGDVP